MNFNRVGASPPGRSSGEWMEVGEVLRCAFHKA